MLRNQKPWFFGKSYNDTSLAPLTISDIPMDFVQEWRYLGVTLKSGKRLGFTARPDITSFYRASNSVLATLRGAHEHVLLTLLYSNCVPVLTYACAVKQYTNNDMSDYNVALNNACRRVFGFTQWQSIRVLRDIFGFKSLYVIFKETQDKFLIACKSHPNPIIKFLLNLNILVA